MVHLTRFVHYNDQFEYSNTDYVFPEGLAWDWVNQKLYWTDSTDDDIEVYDPVTAYRRVLFENGLGSPYSIVVDPGTGYAYSSLHCK